MNQSATSLSSVQNAKKRLTKFLKTLDTVPIVILEQEARKIELQAKLETPRDTGKLESSVKARVARDKRRPGINISASARDKGYNYAGIQHENTHFKHPVKGKAHYLKDPFDRGVRRIKRRLRKEVKL
jgi:hypothetical protein